MAPKPPDWRQWIPNAVQLLQRGGVVAFPTETVYGLGADATQHAAVEKVFAIKGRPATNPLIVHVADAVGARQCVTHWPERAQRLAERFWPGPLTLVLPRSPRIVPAVTAGLPTVGVRCPDHPLTLALLRAWGGAMVGPSANRSTRISPTTADHVRRELGGAVDLILDGGACRVGIESTVVDLTDEHAKILRPGMIDASMLRDILGTLDTGQAVVRTDQPAPSPGLHAVHYAPVTDAYSFTPDHWPALLRRLRSMTSTRAGLLAIEGALPQDGVCGVPSAHLLRLLPDGPHGYARELYGVLRGLDESGVSEIWVLLPPPAAAWEAVHDRLARATRPGHHLLR